jgi:hypothetical protein
MHDAKPGDPLAVRGFKVGACATSSMPWKMNCSRYLLFKHLATGALGRNGVFGAISGQFPAKSKNYQTGVCMGVGSCNYRIQWKALAKAHILDSFSNFHQHQANCNNQSALPCRHFRRSGEVW